MTRHLIHFYDGAYPVEDASDFIAAGLLAGDTCIAILTPPNRQAVERGLVARRMFTTPAGPCSGTFLAMDTHAVLSPLLVDGRLDEACATQALGDMMIPTSSGSGRARVVADLAPTLFAAGNEAAALALETLVDKLATEHSASIFCAYAMTDLQRAGNTHLLVKLCAEHSAVEFPRQPWIHAFMQPVPSVCTDDS